MIKFYPTRTRCILLFCVFFSLSGQFLYGQGYTLTARRNTRISSTSNGFYESLPEGYSGSNSRHPLLIVIPGWGQLGNGGSQLDMVISFGIGQRLSDRTLPASFLASNDTSYSFITIMPQFSNDSDPGSSVNEIIDYCLERYRVLSNRIYITSCSIGGRFLFDAVGQSTTTANRIAAVVPMASRAGYSSEQAQNMVATGLPVWAFHNRLDDVVSVLFTDNWINGINGLNANPAAKKTIYEITGHDCWTAATDPAMKVDNMNIYEWMLSYSRGFDVLPVSFASFQVSRTGPTQAPQVKVDWTTASEENGDHFTIQRSTNGIDFEDIGRVNTQNNPTGASYTFTDQQPLTGISYYRVKQTDIDGSAMYSRIQPVNLQATGAGQIILYPNPAKTQLFFAQEDSYRGQLTWRIINTSGQVLRSGQLFKNQDLIRQEITLGSLPEGQYILEVNGDRYRSSASFVRKL